MNTLKITGSVKIELRDKDGNLKWSHEDHNMVVTTGKNFLAEWLATSSHATKFMSYIALGSGVTPPSLVDTTLQSELVVAGYSRLVGALSYSSNSWINTLTFPAGNGTATISEIGLFDAATSGTMFARQTFSPIAKAAGDAFNIVWTINFS